MLRISKKPGFLLENGYTNMLAHVNQSIEKNLAERITALNAVAERLYLKWAVNLK